MSACIYMITNARGKAGHVLNRASDRCSEHSEREYYEPHEDSWDWQDWGLTLGHSWVLWAPRGLTRLTRLRAGSTDPPTNANSYVFPMPLWNRWHALECCADIPDCVSQSLNLGHTYSADPSVRVVRGFAVDPAAARAHAQISWRIHSLLIIGVVTASSHALWRVLSNKVIWVLGHIQICRLWVRHSPCCTLFLINCFGIEMVLCNLYLKRFDMTKGLLFDTFSITVWYKFCCYDHSVLEMESFSEVHYQWICRQNKKLQIKCIPVEAIKKMCRRPDFSWNKMRRRPDLSNKMRCRPEFLTKS